MSNVVAYLRVSTEKQAEDGLGLEVQEASIRRWADTHGHTILAFYRDEGISGSKEAADRPGLASALAAVEAGAEALVVAKLDRLARHLTVQEAVLAQAWRCGGRVYSVDLGEVLRDDPDDPMRTAMRQMVGVFAQLERAMIAARMRAGRRHKAGKGGYAGYGSPRFGQRAEGRELTADAGEQAVIARIVELRRDGGSLRTIVAALNGEGLRPKRGERWHCETVRRVIARLDIDRGASSVSEAA